MTDKRDAASDAAAELYRLTPEEFIAARDERAKALKGRGEAAVAKQVAALRKPTVGAWLVNLLVADEPKIAGQVSALAEQLRTAQEQLVGADLRALGRQRQELVASLVARARTLARDAGRKVTGSVLDTEVESTLRAALADPDVAREVLSGHLTHATEFAGFGPSPSASRDRARTPPPVRDREGETTRRATDLTHDHGKGGGAKESAAQRRRTEQRERAREEARAKLAAAEEALVAAQDEHAAAETDATAAAQQLASAQERRDELRAHLDRAQSELDQLKDEAEQAKWRTRRAAAAMRAAQASLGRARDRSERAEH